MAIGRKSSFIPRSLKSIRPLCLVNPEKNHVQLWYVRRPTLQYLHCIVIRYSRLPQSKNCDLPHLLHVYTAPKLPPPVPLRSRYLPTTRFTGKGYHSFYGRVGARWMDLSGPNT